MKKILLLIIKVILLLLLLLIFGVKTSGTVEIISKIIILFLLFIELFNVLKYIILIFKNSNKNSAILNFIFSFIIFVLIFILLEATFLLIPRSHGVGYTKAAQNWLQFYWRTNSLGLRDSEPIKSNNSILFVGDSFTAGHGIKNESDRFSNIVGERLNNFQSINIGINGLDTKGEFVNMIDFIHKTEIKPQVIVLQYFGNDIDKVAMSNGLSFNGFKPYNYLNSVFSFIIRGSHFVNYLYWLFPQTDVQPYTNFLAEAYSNNNILMKHQEDLFNFIDYANHEKIKMIVIVFPFMRNLEQSDEFYVNKIINFFNSYNIETINVSSLVRNNRVNNLVVNNNDGHASVDVNRIVAHEIISILNNKQHSK